MKALQLAAALFTALTTTAAAQGPVPAKTRTLLCHGGSPFMVIHVAHDLQGSGANTYVNYAHMDIMGLKTASAPASVRPPESGECAWMDEVTLPGGFSSPLKDPVPSTIYMQTSPNIELAFQVKGDGEILRDSMGPWIRVEIPSAPQAAEWQTMIHAILDGWLFTVEVSFSGGAWVVQHVGKAP